MPGRCRAPPGERGKIMADTVEINVAVRADPTQPDAVKTGLIALNAPLMALSSASAQASQAQQQMMQRMGEDSLYAARAMQQADAAYVTAFKNSMQVMADSKQISLQQAL